jgi:hypothetical protein
MFTTAQMWFLYIPAILIACSSNVAADFNQSHFALYKNTAIVQCAPFEPVNATQILAEAVDLDNNPLSIQAGRDNTFNANIATSSAFCALFWNYTVIPSTPNGSAFIIMGSSTLIRFVILEVPMFVLLFEMAAQESWGWFSDSQENVSLLGNFTWSRSILFVYDSLSTVYWWYEFGSLCHDITSVGPLFILAWMTPLSYLVTITGVGSTVKRFRSLALALALSQFIATIPAVVLMAKPVINYDLDSSIGVFGNCTASELLLHPGLLMDPNATTTKVSKTIPAIYLTLGLFVLGLFSFFGLRVEEKQSGRIVWTIVSMFVGLAFVMQLVAGALDGGGGTPQFSPIVWLPQCQVVHVMMSQREPYYLDVVLGRGLRRLKAALGR